MNEMKKQSITFEVCIDSVAGAITAERAGANRLELCGALSEGGITPSFGMVQAVLTSTRLPVMMMIRCRGGSFCYDASEMATMLKDIGIAKALGVHGVVFGVLTADGQIDVDSNRRMIEAARPLNVTFHRAFDEPHIDPLAALGTLHELGVDRLLTSGQQPSALDGARLIADLRKRSEFVEIMPGAGVRPENVAEIMQATGSREVHGTASRFCETKQQRITCEDTVRKIREELDEIA